MKYFTFLQKIPWKQIFANDTFLCFYDIFSTSFERVIFCEIHSQFFRETTQQGTFRQFRFFLSNCCKISSNQTIFMKEAIFNSYQKSLKPSTDFSVKLNWRVNVKNSVKTFVLLLSLILSDFLVKIPWKQVIYKYILQLEFTIFFSPWREVKDFNFYVKLLQYSLN